MILSAAAALGNAMGRSDHAHSYDNLLRLHVVAHSDAPEDQRVKLLVRDALLKEMSAWPAPRDRRQLELALLEKKERLEALAEEALRLEGMSHGVRVEIGDFAFPDKRSGAAFLPAGTYRAVRVVIGDGAGRNWWCVLFPPLCFAGDDLLGSEVSAGQGRSPAPASLLAKAAEARTPEAGSIPPAEAGGDAGPEPGVGEDFSNYGPEAEVEHPGRRVAWRLRLWERLSESAYAAAVRGLVFVALGGDLER